MGDEKPEWSDGFAAELLGSVVLVGITRRAATGDTQEQFFGIVERADAEGINLALGDSRSGESFFLPPDTRNFLPAQAGSYRLRATGEVLEKPDFTSIWTIEPDDEDDDE
ncbi:hypothetical protein [Sphingomonas antarctica]|uniref:hypothetical protein n=1 Tax=Sphingomonas antarctica TaxID=2040274 RepID=UPI0039E9953B